MRNEGAFVPTAASSIYVFGSASYVVVRTYDTASREYPPFDVGLMLLLALGGY
jgi:hypothetical protein